MTEKTEQGGQEVAHLKSLKKDDLVKLLLDEREAHREELDGVHEHHQMVGQMHEREHEANLKTMRRRTEALKRQHELEIARLEGVGAGRDDSLKTVLNFLVAQAAKSGNPVEAVSPLEALKRLRDLMGPEFDREDSGDDFGI